ncbi:MAG: DUF4364 family protein [Clostridia bacterium]|nr:DUF4364 family protein [Clostridia bacterium]
MAKKKEYTLKTITDIKIFILFLLDTIRYPVDYTTLWDILYENMPVLSTDYEESLDALTDEGHIIADEIDGERYMMISESGRRLSSVLYDTLDPAFREKTMKSAIKHVSLSDRGIRVSTSVDEDASGRYRVSLVSEDRFGQILHLSLTVNSRAEADTIRENFSSRPDSVYRGVLFSATGKIGFLS